MGFTPLAFWGSNLGTIVPNGIVFYHTPTSFAGSSQWLDVSGNNNHCNVSGAFMGNDTTGWIFNGGTFSTGSNSLIWSSSLNAQPSSSFTLQWYGKQFTEGNPVFNQRYLWRTTNQTQDLSGSGWSISYNVDYYDILYFSGSTNTAGGQMYPLSASYFNGTTPYVFTMTFQNGTASLYVDDNPIVVATRAANIFEFTGSTSGQPYPLTFGKAPLHVRCDAYNGSNSIGQSTTWGYIDENHNYQEGVSSYNNDFSAFVWPNTKMYRVSGQNRTPTSLINVGPAVTSSLLEPLINQNGPFGNGIYGIGFSGSINSLLCYNRVLSENEIINNVRVLRNGPDLTPNILPTPQPPAPVTQSATNLSLYLDAKNGYWYNQRTWYDISGNGNNLTLTSEYSGSVTYDPITGSVGFYGNSLDYFSRTGGTTGLNLNVSASMEVWLKWWGGNDNYYRTAFVMGKSAAGAASGSLLSALYADDGFSDGLETRWGTGTLASYVPAFDATHNYTKQNSNNIWRQVVLVKTGDSIDYYVNGTLENTRTGFSGVIVSGSNIQIGGLGPIGATSANITNQFIGEVAIVKVWNGTSLSATDVSASFASNRSRFGI